MLTAIFWLMRSASTTQWNNRGATGIPLDPRKVWSRGRTKILTMRKRGCVAAVLAALAPLGLLAAPAATGASPGAPGSSTCPPASPTAHPTPAASLRFGIDPGLAGEPLPEPASPVPVDERAEHAALRALRPAHRELVIRLNRLFWSGGESALQSFARRARAYTRDGFLVEVQVRYHPTAAENGDIPAWVAWVRHVTDVLAANHRLVALTITNEVNLTISPNTSDGSYKSAEPALVRGVEAAYQELRRHGWAQRVKVGFTFAYRFNPSSDAALFHYLGSSGPQFRRALGFVGLDDYPGTVYPPTLVPPVDTAGDELASAIATMRTCFLPMAKISSRTPLWVTENGYPSGGSGDQSQVAALRSMVDATHTYGGTYDVTDYRWFNLRDNNSSGTGMFDKDGLLRDNDARKPSFAAYRKLIARYGS
jgi:hypothetical protein